MKLPTMVTAGLLMAVLGMAPGAQAQGTQVDTKLEQRAASARTAKEHVAVSREYRERAERFEAKAREHEVAARRADRNTPSLNRKWPGSTLDTAAKERQKAIEARRAAAEAFAIADEHMRASVEALADAAPERATNRTN